ncbi:exportin-T-like [Hydractinia symbiolongicarpus]|uniref:exportin-T-like n=1 Tax=Hydractinia symbiolongicarpus TaxID=13093 RepID=UPI00254C9A76|nr:exportin-T-like [Hydractinia symbiolongicarpus]
MDEGIVQLLTVGDSPGAQTHILSYFEQLKKQDEGWQICGDVLARNLYEDERVKFFCLQVMENHIRLRYQSFNDLHRQKFKLCLQQWFHNCCGTEHKVFIRNKTAQLFCLLFIQEYPEKWSSFFNEMLSLLEGGPLAVDGYLRVLVAIDEEVVARHIPHTQEEFQRNTKIKDHMRDHCVNDLVESWYQILKLYEQCNGAVVCLCLKVIGAYISWIDINLIANERFISCLLSYLESEEIRESSCECLLEIINKGMDAGGKTRLVESLSDALVKTRIMEVNSSACGDVDFIVKLSALINGMGVQLITSFNKLTKEEAENGLKSEILQAVDAKIPHMLRFLGDEDDDISEAMTEFCHSYLGLLKQLNGSNLMDCRKHVKNLLVVIVNKMKYDEEFNFENENDEEAEFIEFRKQIKVLLTNLAALDGDTVLLSIHEIVIHTLGAWQNFSFKDVEVAIYVLYCLAESFPGQVLYIDEQKSKAFQDMMSLLVTSGVSQHPHSAVKLEYFETVTRYERFFYAQTEHIPAVLESFLDERGLRSMNKSVCSRSSFLFMRFIKSLKNQVNQYVEDILKRLQDLLVTNKQDKLQTQLSENDRYYLYETAAVVISCSNTTQEKHLELMKSLLSPVLVSSQTLLDQISNRQLDKEQSLQLADELHHLIAYASRASKAFSTAHTLKQSGCTGCFTEALNLFLHSLTIPVHRNIIHTAVRQYLHRMIICLHEQVLPFVPIAVTHLLKDCEMRDIQDFIPLINQLITRFKNDIAPFLSEILMPLVTQIFTFLQSPVEANDQQALKEKQLLQRSYFLFISTIVNNNILEVLLNQDSSNVKEILLSIVHGAVEIPDPQGQKTCFIIFNKLLEYWGHNEDFKDFIYDSILPSCFRAPLNPAFDLQDAQTMLVLNEIANAQKTTLQKRGVEFIQWLEQSYLPQNNCPVEIIQEYSQAVQTLNVKSFKNYLKAFYSRWKT